MWIFTIATEQYGSVHKMDIINANILWFCDTCGSGNWMDRDLKCDSCANSINENSTLLDLTTLQNKKAIDKAYDGGPYFMNGGRSLRFVTD